MSQKTLDQPLHKSKPKRQQSRMRIAVGCSLPCNAYSRHGLLLLARGELIASDEQVHRLLQPGIIFSDTPPKIRAQSLLERQHTRNLLKRDDWEDEAEVEAEAVQEAGKKTQVVVPPPKPQVPLVEEIPAARAIRRQAIYRMSEIVDQVQCSQEVDIDSAQLVVMQLFDSLKRNERALSSLVRLKHLDSYTFTHSVNTCILSVILAKRCGIRKNLEAFGLGALLHDIGKIWIPLETLQKGCTLDDEEWELVRRHPMFGVEIVGQSPAANECNLAAIGEHHERANGTGYPRKLSGSEFTLAGRIVAIADVYDALTSDRPYRKRLSPPEAMRIIAEGAGEHFDHAAARTFISSIGVFPVGSLVRLSNSELAVVADVNVDAIRRPSVIVVSDGYRTQTRKPRWLDLSKVAHSNEGLEVVSVEDPLDYEIDVEEYLGISSKLQQDTPQELDLRV